MTEGGARAAANETHHPDAETGLGQPSASEGTSETDEKQDKGRFPPEVIESIMHYLGAARKRRSLVPLKKVTFKRLEPSLFSQEHFDGLRQAFSNPNLMRAVVEMKPRQWLGAKEQAEKAVWKSLPTVKIVNVTSV